MNRTAWIIAAILALTPTAGAESQSAAQHGELYTQGALTGGDGRIWDVRFIPGSSAVNEELIDGWSDAGSTLAELVGGELWGDDIPDAIVDGAEFSRDVVVEHFAEGIGDDVRRAQSRNRELQSGDFGRGFIISWNWMKATAAILGRTLWLPVGTVGGLTYSAVAPLVMVSWRPIEATLHAGVRGVAIPITGHVWNTTAWSATFFNAVPERETRWVSRAYGQQGIVLSDVDLEAFVRGVVAEAMVDERNAALQTELDATEERLRVLQEERRAHHGRMQALREELEQSEDFLAKQRVEADANYGAELSLDTAANRALADTAALDAQIAEALVGQGAEASRLRVTHVRERVLRELDRLLDE